MKPTTFGLTALLLATAAIPSVQGPATGQPFGSVMTSAAALARSDYVEWDAHGLPQRPSGASKEVTATAGTESPEPELKPRVTPEKPAHTTVGPGFSRERVHLKFREGTGIRFRGEGFVADPARNLSDLSTVLTRWPGIRVERLFSRPEAELALDHARLEAKAGRDLPDLNLWYRVVLPAGGDIEAVIDSLNALDVVEIAYPQPLPAPPPTVSTSPSFEPYQGYLDAAPTGVNARAAWAVPGGTGSHVRVVDIESTWNVDHEDLSKAPGALIELGTPLTGPGNHGTAVVGVLVADKNSFGVTGVVPDADLRMVNAVNVENGDVTAEAIDLARANTAPGDVILIEVAAPYSGPLPAPCSVDQWEPLVPVEFWQANFDAIQTATADDRIVIEPAANDGCDLDAPLFEGKFDRAVRDSGAIMVGGGAPRAPSCYWSPARSRLWWSTYGSRVDVQGWGECVMTTGYGWLYGPGPNQDYTHGFSGTSSAGAVVAGAVAAIQSANFASTGSKLDPVTMRQLLVDTGTPQDLEDRLGYPNTGHIGPLPDIAAALGLLEVDLTVAATVLVEEDSKVVAVNPVTNRIYVSSMWERSVTVIDGATNSVVDTVPFSCMAGALAVNPSTNRIYVGVDCGDLSGGVEVIDGATNTVVAGISMGVPQGIGVNPATNLVYASGSGYGPDYVAVIDGATNTRVGTIAETYGAKGVAVNPTTNRVYVACENAGAVRVIDGATNTVVADLFVGGWPTHLATNPNTNRIYVSRFEGPEGDSIAVIDGTADTLIETLYAVDGPRRIAVDSDTNRVYVANENAGVVQVIEGDTNAVKTPVSLGGTPRSVAINPVTDRVYVLTGERFGPSTVFVLEPTGTESARGGDTARR